MAGFAGCVACARRFPHFTLCFLCIPAGKLFAVGMDQKDCFFVHTPVVFTGVVLGRCSHARFGVRQWWLPGRWKGRGCPPPLGRGRGGGVAGSLTPR